MNENKTYKIETLTELLDVVNKENFEDIMKDLLSFVEYSMGMFDNFKSHNPQYSKLKNSEISPRIVFEWTDDRINKITGLELINTKTGETKTFEL